VIVRRRTCAQFLGLLVCLSFLGGTAEAAPGPWITPAKNISLSAKSSLNNADVAVDGRGTAVAVWLAHRESENPEDYGTETIMAAVRPKGGKFGNPFAPRWQFCRDLDSDETRLGFHRPRLDPPAW